MPTLVTATVVLAMMLDAESGAASSPNRPNFEPVSEAIATVANEAPLFAGDDGPLRTSALFASLQWFESNTKIDAAGDCRYQDARGRCLVSRPDRGDPQSFGLYQIGRSNFITLAVTVEEMTTSPLVQTRAARRMVAASIAICRSRASEDLLLTQYAKGGEGCEGADAEKKSGHRMRKAKWLFDRAKKRSAA